MANGLSYSKVHTPLLVRDYLRGEGFPGAGEDGSKGIEPGRGDYLASNHRHLKGRIKELNSRQH